MGKPAAAAIDVSLVSTASYLPFGPLSSLTFGNGRVQTRVFDRNYAADRVFDGAANDGFAIDLGLDDAGNVISLAERQGASSVLRQVDYDGLNRLTAQRDGAALIEGFGYDATGNRSTRSTASATTPYTTAPGSHRLQSVGPSTRSHDAAGNTTAINDPAPRTLVYNDLGRLRDARVSGTLQASYRYNGRGERIVKLHPTDINQNRYFVYTDSGQLLGEYTRTGARIAEYVWLEETLVALYADHDASTYQFVQTDHLGTPRAVVHPSRNRIVWRWDLAGSAFGDHPPVVDPDGDGKVFGLNLRYPGQYFDAESGLHYNYFRDYDPTTGRYVESDPIGLDGGISTYGYALQRPTGLTDPLGLAPQSACCAAAIRAGLDRNAVDPSQHDRGFVACCNGKKFSCYNVRSDRVSDPVAFEIIGDCGTGHEDSHKPKVTCPPCGDVSRPGWDSNDPFVASANECVAYGKQLRCLERKKRRCTTYECTSQVGAEIARVRSSGTASCGGVAW